MKQHITKEQWDELDKDEQIHFKQNITLELHKSFKPTIGQMIEFLGDDFESITQLRTKWDDTIDGWEVSIMVSEVGGVVVGADEKELCDTLWQAVKHKIKQ